MNPTLSLSLLPKAQVAPGHTKNTHCAVSIKTLRFWVTIAFMSECVVPSNETNLTYWGFAAITIDMNKE